MPALTPEDIAKGKELAAALKRSPNDLNWIRITAVPASDVVWEALVDGYVLGTAFSPSYGPWAYCHDGQGLGQDSIAITGVNIEEYIEAGKVRALELLEQVRLLTPGLAKVIRPEATEYNYGEKAEVADAL